jgi:hypothetical protein
MNDAPTNLPPNEPVKKMARQRRWEDRKRAEGKCIICGRPKGDSPYALWCRRHGALHKLRGQKKRRNVKPGSKPKGRQPIDIPVRSIADVDRLFPAIPPNPRKKTKEQPPNVA